jgi:hypothetical protein
MRGKIFRSAREAVGHLIEQSLPGDFVRVGGAESLFGRVLSPDDPALAEMQPDPTRVYVQTQTGQVQAFDPQDLEKASAFEIPPDVITAIASRQDQQLAQEVLDDVNPDLAEEFGLRQDPFVDPLKSKAASQAQRMPDTRLAKSRAMRRNWRRTKSRSGRPVLGNEPQAMRNFRPFESLIEQELDRMVEPENADNNREPFGEQPTTYTASSSVDPRVAYNMTMRVFEASNEIMKTLAIARGMPYYMWLQDDPEEGKIRLKINGTCPKEIVEKFVRNLDEIELTMLEKPEGEENDRDRIGNWVFETHLPGFPDEYEEPEYEPEQAEYGAQGEYPGEVVLPEEPAGAGMMGA